MPANEEVVSHWHHSAHDFGTSTVAFYNAIEEELRASEAPVKCSRIQWSEGGFFSAKREYLRVEFQGLGFTVCAAPFGRNYFFSWWLTEPRPGTGCLGAFAWPVLGPLLRGLVKPTTYYSIDTRLIFQESVHSIVLGLVEGELAAKGARALAPEERKVTAKDLL